MWADWYIYIYIYIYIYCALGKLLFKLHKKKISLTSHFIRDIGPAVRVLWPGRPGFNPRSSHTKDFKNGT